MASLRCYHRFLLTVMAIGGAAAVAGIVLLVLGISMPGTIVLIAGIMAGTVAGMEWRCRERPGLLHRLRQPPIEVVVVTVQPPSG